MLVYEKLNKYQKISFITVNIQVVWGILGILANILTILVFSRKSLRHHSYSFYWRVMSVADMIVLLETFDNWSSYILNIDIQLISPFFCTFNQYQPHVAGFISHWMLALVSIDRFFAIAYPKRFGLFRKRWFQIALVFIVVIYCFLSHIELPLNYTLKRVNGSSNSLVCYLPDKVQFRSSYMIMINIILVNIVINNILHVKLVFSIRASKRKTRRNRTRSTIRDRKFAMSSIVMNIASFVSKMPFAVGMYFSSYFALGLDQHQNVFYITGLIALIDHGDSLLINLCVNSIFYNEFRRMLKFKSGN